jgi:hypothetical protein
MGASAADAVAAGVAAGVASGLPEQAVAATATSKPTTARQTADRVDGVFMFVSFSVGLA